MKILLPLTLCHLAIALLSAISTAQASVVINGTRLIYPAEKKDISVQLTNNDPQVALVNTWIDSGDERQDPSRSTAPFVVTPPVTRVAAGKKQLIRITFQGTSPLPADRESVFWFNSLGVPSKNKANEDDNILQVALRTRIKLFYRPTGLSGDATEAAKNMSWQGIKTQQGYGIRAVNHSAFHVSMTTVSINEGGKRYTYELGGMVPPQGGKDFILKGLTHLPAANSPVTYGWVNDYGSTVTDKAVVKNNE